MSSTPSQPTFADLALTDSLLKALDEVGYETPSPIQAECIPHLLEGSDILGQAQTGSGKTAAFALPLLARLNLKETKPQVLVLTPTRELAIQVAEAFQSYAKYMKGFHVLPIYGGQSYSVQLRQLKRGVHVVVGTPGRVMDNIRRGSLQLDNLQALVLDEADEMLRMGFIDDVEWIMDQTPATRQVALFSATMPTVIRKVARQHLKDPKEIKIAMQTATAETISQRYWAVRGVNKLDALTRILEVENFDAMIIFVRTKTATIELAEKLEARGYSCAALNGDMPQKQREMTVSRLKKQQLDIVIATDVAARGLDVERISHVVNYDIPYDTEAYIHRIGRTGRAGREGQAILFVAPREMRMLRAIEKATKQTIAAMALPSPKDINDQRIERFKQRITDTMAGDGLELFYKLVSEYQAEHEVDAINIAAALAKMVQGEQPLLLNLKAEKFKSEEPEEKGRKRRQYSHQAEPLKAHPDIEMQRYQVDVGRDHGLKPGNLVGAIANEADIESQYIGEICIYDEFSTVDLPAGMPKDVLQLLKGVYVCSQKLNIGTAGKELPVTERKPKRNKKQDSFKGSKRRKSNSNSNSNSSRQAKSGKKTKPVKK
ncbi:DEAD/DEAH box helicase [Endozoicomonas sp. SM1973]|uniref:ATP-dependent RNA helicase DeaD n=1 Tax=Spartinivicinus marinus TaxID=2994442 RepID=A0A853I3L7_9GAMM|nr:DEAD/DEAH box helicase [Spartinivicinus marinus]MCX4027726.1 DEAD/DEAH box helicase [Spartinivicinus marinus]NYZ68530.1 DEAD/DEAH box helicase [Spartinivicinus marinus]